MCRLGANVTGIDASNKNINVAKLHAAKNNLNINYLNMVPEKLSQKKEFDIILNLEIVEHVENLDLFLESCYKLLKPGGIMFTATINKTFTSYIKAIIGAEYILRWLPIGTHECEKFVEPSKLINCGKRCSLKLEKVDGITFSPFRNEWSVSNDKSVNYIVEFRKL